MSDKEVSLLETLAECATVLELCTFTCLAQRNTLLIRCIYLNNQCAEVCHSTVKLLRVNLADVSSYLSVCEETLSLCMEECRKHTGIRYCLKCADVCEKGLQACREALSLSPLKPMHTNQVKELALLQ